MRYGMVLLVIFVAVGLLIVNHDRGEVFGLPSGDFSRIVLLGTVATVAGAAVLRGFRGRFGALLQSAAVWLALVFVLVAGYGYKEDLKAFAERAVAGLSPGTAINAGPGAVMVAKSNDGHFRVKATVNGRTIRLVVDTGASSVVLTDRDAREIGLDMARLRYDIRVSTANGTTQAAPVVLDRIEIGEIVESRVSALVARPGQLETSLLGNSFLSRMASFTIEGDRLTLRR
ncbi:retropepsin-like aspartic protease family protein [Prosthecodimorpha staleyi]|uniref:TIGR02281 family clan AA aspartic protease n=1 Tax=Prosthecodimorpha staleyi TaxID=2840188 RepID=A0A947GBQ6_9HYPH|nr:TIGR02281 family clan AA aspartic protease [Prosthecodimorpha staleyi]MBT9290538.1 TIGR02281 family clan AA aspartic protease [Prosthecodimorpha staleyi]